MRNLNKKSGGQVIMITVVAFLIISLAMIAGVAVPTSNQIKSVLDMKHSKQGYIAADSAVEEVYYRLNKQKISFSYTGPVTLPFTFEANASSSALVSGDSSSKTITGVGMDGNATRYGKSSLSIGTGVAFSYGVQTGNGGITMANNSDITGNVYTNGSIIGGAGNANNKVITGSAVAANSADPTANTENNNPVDAPTDSIVFGKVFASAADFAQSFQVTGNLPVHSVSLYIKKFGLPSNATVRIMSNSGTSPGTDLLATQGTLVATNVIDTAYSWVDVVFPSNPTLNAGTTYWLVIDTPITVDKPNDYYIIAANNSIYPSGVVKAGKYNTSWNATSPATLDSYFKLYSSSSGSLSTISSVKVGSSAADTAWAHTISGVTGSSVKKCAASPCVISTDDPSPTGFPVSDGNIATWQDEAIATGNITTGNVSIGNNQTIGPRKIIGNLHITADSSTPAKLTGTVWVTGTLTVDNHAVLKLDSSYASNSGVIVVDGITVIENGGDLKGTGILTNGKETSFIMVVSNSTASNAVDLNNNGGAVVINAQKGTVQLSNNAFLNQVTAKTLDLQENSHVTYKEGLADQNFTSGPSGSWNIDSWAEAPSP